MFSTLMRWAKEPAPGKKEGQSSAAEDAARAIDQRIFERMRTKAISRMADLIEPLPHETLEQELPETMEEVRHSPPKWWDFTRDETRIIFAQYQNDEIFRDAVNAEVARRNLSTPEAQAA